jgi:branched-chain amino acid transport system ATP-binding protein
MLIQINNINVYYDDFHVLDNVSLNINESSLINSISGINKVRSGEIKFKKTTISNLPANEIVDLGIIQVPEGRKLFPSLTVRENLLIGAYSKYAKERREKRIDKVLEFVPALKDKMNRLAGSMSGGEQQMCAIGRGLMGQPNVLMLDEPSLGLAPKIVDEMFNIIIQIKKSGKSILLVEQNVGLSLDISDRAYILESGRVVLSGTAKEIEDNPELRKSYLGI